MTPYFFFLLSLSLYLIYNLIRKLKSQTFILNYFKLNAGSAASYPFSYGTVTLYAATLLTDTLELSNQRLTLTVLPHLSVKVPGAATDISVHIDAHYCTSAWAIYNLRYRDSTSATMLADTSESLRWCVTTPKRAIYNRY